MIKNDAGRPAFESVLEGGDQAKPRKGTPRQWIAPVNKLNDLTAKEWIQETISVWTQRGLGQGHQEALIEREHPAPFSFQDISRLIRFFTKAGDTVLDPFVGVGSTLKAAALEKRAGIGIELNKKYADLARKRLKLELKDKTWQRKQRVIQGDARKAIQRIGTGTIKLVVTSPPYWNILHKQDHKAKQERSDHGLDTKYSSSEQDLGNIGDYETFLTVLCDTLAQTHRCLTDGGHLCVVLGDFRHKSRYYMFHSDVAIEMQARGFSLRGMTVLYQKHKRVFPYGYPHAYVPNLHHQYILILAK